MAFTTVDQIRDSLNGETIFAPVILPNATAGGWGSGWLGGSPFAGVAPSSGMAGDIPTEATLGAIPISDPASGDNYLLDVNMVNTGPGVLYLYDRLWHQSGINATLTTSQTINSVALDRPDANGVGAELWIDSYTAMGAGTPTITVSYTNTVGTSGRTATCVIPAASFVQGRTFMFTLDTGDFGVKSVQTFTQSATRTSGTSGLVLRRRIASIPMPAATQGLVKADAFALGMPKIETNACLEWIFVGHTSIAAGVRPAQGTITVGYA